MTKLNTPEQLLTIATLGGIAGYLVYANPKSGLLMLIVGGFLTYLNPQQKAPTP